MEINHLEKTVAFLTLGCKVNSYETDAMEKLFQESGYLIKPFNEKVSIYVVNTCTVTNIADRKSRQMLHKAKKMNPDSVVVAVGCYVQAAKETLDTDESIDVVVGNNQKKNIVSIVEHYLKDKTYLEPLIDINSVRDYEELSIESVGEKTRAYIKVQDGCNQFCSYCIIPFARGRVRSRNKEDVIAEVEKLVEKGYKEVVLTGIHLSSYGLESDKKQLESDKRQLKSDKSRLEIDKNCLEDDKSRTEDYFEDKERENRLPLLELILAVSKVDGLKRIRLGSLEPRIITEEFVKEIAQTEKVCPHFHLSLQSGSDKTLKRMNRRYTAQEYLEKCDLLRKYYNDPAITTDIIVGFPGETEEEFEETKQFVEKIGFAGTHIFKYSKRKGTKAESMPDQVDEKIKASRSNVLLECNRKATREYQERFIGSVQKILIEEKIEIDGKIYQIGHNERYMKLAIEAENDCINEIVEGVILEHLTEDIIRCKIIG